MIPDSLRSLTVRQPHASAIVSGLKTIENRPWPFPGTIPPPAEIAIHASIRDDPRWGSHWPRELTRLADPERENLSKLPHGVILGVVTVVACTRDAHLRNSWAIDGYWHWHLSDARPLRSPILWRGRQGLMPLPIEVVEQIRYQLS